MMLSPSRHTPAANMRGVIDLRNALGCPAESAASFKVLVRADTPSRRITTVAKYRNDSKRHEKMALR
jgi:hypothetical protein